MIRTGQGNCEQHSDELPLFSSLSERDCKIVPGKLQYQVPYCTIVHSSATVPVHELVNLIKRACYVTRRPGYCTRYVVC